MNFLRIIQNTCEFRIVFLANSLLSSSWSLSGVDLFTEKKLYNEYLRYVLIQNVQCFFTFHFVSRNVSAFSPGTRGWAYSWRPISHWHTPWCWNSEILLRNKWKWISYEAKRYSYFVMTFHKSRNSITSAMFYSHREYSKDCSIPPWIYFWTWCFSLQKFKLSWNSIGF